MTENTVIRKSAKYYFIAILFYAAGCWLFWPSVSFESSDGNWGDNEIPLKNRDFDSMAYFFELYRIKCNAKEAVLYRTTPEQYWNIFHWPSYLLEKKWRVPYKSESPHIKGGAFPDITKANCFNGPESDAIVNEASKRAKDYIKSL